MKREEEKFLKKGLDTPFEKQPDGQISRPASPRPADPLSPVYRCASST